MATWHQNKALYESKGQLWHETKWSLVVDPPNDMRTITLYDTEAEAMRDMAKYKHCYVLRPGPARKR